MTLGLLQLAIDLPPEDWSYRHVWAYLPLLLLHWPGDRLEALPMKNRLRVLRAERNWTQADLAERLEVSRQTVNAIETEKYEPSLSLAFKIARLFGQADRGHLPARRIQRHGPGLTTKHSSRRTRESSLKSEKPSFARRSASAAGYAWAVPPATTYSTPYTMPRSAYRRDSTRDAPGLDVQGLRQGRDHPLPTTCRRYSAGDL